MTLVVYGIKQCDTMKKAFQWLDAAQIPYQFVDFKTHPPSNGLVETWLEALGDALVNTRGTSYRQLPEAIRGDFRGAVRVRAIVEKPTLIKRPLLVNGSSMTVGFAPGIWGTIPGLLPTR